MVKEDERAAESLTAALAEIVGAKRYDAWFARGVEFDATDPQTLRVRVGTSLQRDCLRKHFRAELRDACVRAGLGKRRVEFQIDAPSPQSNGREAPAAPPTPKRPARPPAQAAAGPPDLAGYIVGDSNREAAALAARLVCGGHAPSPAVLWGPAGTGKTHLLRAVRAEARQRRRRVHAEYLTAEAFTSGFVDAIQQRSLASFRGRRRGVDLLLLDDVHFLLGKQKTLEELQYTLDALNAEGAAVVLASDRSPGELRKIGGELLSRLGAGVAVELRRPDVETKTRLVERFAQRAGLELPAGAATQIAGGVLGAARELQGVVNKLHLAATLLGEQPGAEQVQKAVDDMNRMSTPSVRIRDIQDAVCHVFGMDAAMLKSNKRTKAVTEPRMLAMWLSRKYTQSAWSEIGDQFGRRSHSTVISACRRVEQLMLGQTAVRVSGGPCDLHEAVRLVEVQLRKA